MNNRTRRRIITLLCSALLLPVLALPGSAEDYEALKGVSSVNTMFDFRDGIPQPALIHLKLIHDTYNDPAIRAASGKPEFVVVFMASSVKLLSKNRDGFSAEEKKMLEEFDQVLAAMAKDGIRLEICMFAGNVMGVDPASLPNVLIHVPNGWISAIGYQKRGYAMVPVY
jgi:intracellular sulfur oxidation DsrE/DsrF family protein